jgi:hypothetical protein
MLVSDHILINGVLLVYQINAALSWKISVIAE